MADKIFNIQEFFGVIQSRYGSLLNPGTAWDARNMDTSDGSLRVAKGFERYIPAPVPGEGKLIKLMIAKGAEQPFYVVAADGIYHYANEWTRIHAFAEPITKDVGHLQTKIGTKDYIIVATGQTQMLKIDLSTHAVSIFGSGATSYAGKVASYDSGTKKITLSTAITEDEAKRALSFGITIKEDNMQVDKVDAAAKTLTLTSTPTTVPAANDDLTIPGGGSDAHVAFPVMFYSRLFCAGDPENPGRLYWSAAAGEGRTIEDWLAVPGSTDASGGFVDIGDTTSDPIIGLGVISNQMLIFKRYTVYRLFGDRPGNYTIECVEPASGLMANGSITVKYDVPYYLGKQGIMYFNNVSVVPLDGGQRHIRDFMGIADVSYCHSANLRNVLYFSCRTGGGAYDNAIIVYDATRSTYMIRDGFEVADIEVWDDEVYILSGARHVCVFDKGATYDGAPIHAYWESQETDLDQKYAEKQIKELYLLCEGETFVVRVLAGNSTREMKRLLRFDNTGENLVELPVMIDQSRSFRFRFENEAGSYFRIKGGMQVRLGNEVRK